MSNWAFELNKVGAALLTCAGFANVVAVADDAAALHCAERLTRVSLLSIESTKLRAHFRGGHHSLSCESHWLTLKLPVLLFASCWQVLCWLSHARCAAERKSGCIVMWSVHPVLK
jgi:hypothetical protein